MHFFTDDSLIILVSAPNAVEPGIYRWKRDVGAPTKLCSIASPTSFSFDRKTIIERVPGAVTELRLYSPSTCRLRDRITINGRVLDTEARGNLIAVALRTSDTTNELRVYGTPAKRVKSGREFARAEIGRNVELGFAPDGRSIVNFDLDDSGATAWRVPSLASIKLPMWVSEGETTFVPGSTFVKRYVQDSLSVARWPNGTSAYTIAAAQTVRLRQLSTTGRYGALHSIDSLAPSDQTLAWIDFATQTREQLATGSIDNAAINAMGNRVAWLRRSNEYPDLVNLRFAQINASGNGFSSNSVK